MGGGIYVVLTRGPLAKQSAVGRRVTSEYRVSWSITGTRRYAT